MQYFVRLEIAFWLLPPLMSIAALGWWWRSLDRRALFGITSFLALVGMEFLIRRLAMPVPMVNLDPVSGPGAGPASNQVDAVLATVDSAHTRSALAAMALLLVVGTGFLAWLRRGFRPR